MKKIPSSLTDRFDWQKCILTDPFLSFGAKAIGLYLDCCMMSNSFTFPSLSTISRQMKSTKKTVIKYLKELEEQGWIEKRAGERRSNTYHKQYPDHVLEQVLEDFNGVEFTPPEEKGVSNGNPSGVNITPLGVSNGNPNREIEKKKEKINGRFKKPTVGDVKDYTAENSYKVDAQRFVDHYESVGWVVGKNKTPMKDWQAAVRLWHSRHVEKNPDVTVRVYDASGRPISDNGTGTLL